MIPERTNGEILVRLPAHVDLKELQNMLDYLGYKETTANSKADQKEVDALSDKVNKNIWSNYKAQRNLKRRLL